MRVEKRPQSYIYLTLKMQKQTHINMSSINVACCYFLQTFSIFFCIYRQTVWILIRLLQSDLSPHCLQNDIYSNHQPTKQTATVAIKMSKTKIYLLRFITEALFVKTLNFQVFIVNGYSNLNISQNFQQMKQC